jgi:tRNA pseudouridine32 synthase/23S rRNA pseudouridine746 synthase
MWVDRVLFLDGEALVIDKPAGLPVDAPRDGSLSLENHLLRLRFGFERLPSPVHRLDRDTSGCLLLARNPKAHKRFSLAFEESKVSKSYLAIVDGIPEASEGMIDMPLSKISSKERGWRIVPDPRGKPSVSRWRVAGVKDGRAAILFTPETGRTHQLRVHAAEGLKLPISGDPVYGSGRAPHSTGSGQAMLLHALSLRLERGDKHPIEAEAPLPPSFVHAGFGDVLA